MITSSGTEKDTVDVNQPKQTAEKNSKIQRKNETSPAQDLALSRNETARGATFDERTDETSAFRLTTYIHICVDGSAHFSFFCVCLCQSADPREVH